MSELKFKIGDDVRVLFFESACTKPARTSSHYWHGPCPKPFFHGVIRDVLQRQDDSDGNLYAVEFDQSDVADIMKILRQNTDPDCGLHNCSLLKNDRGRWILEDAMIPWHTTEKKSVTHTNYLRKVIMLSKHTIQKNQKEPYHDGSA